MKVGDKQIGSPQIQYRATKATIEALTGIQQGAIAYATDTDQLGTYSGSTWAWIDPNAASDAADITYTPSTLADWDGSVDPGDVADALDQLAERVSSVGGSIALDDISDVALLNEQTGDVLVYDEGDITYRWMTSAEDKAGIVVTSDKTIDGGNPAANCVDGNDGNYTSFMYTQTSGQWIKFDLGVERNLTKIDIYTTHSSDYLRGGRIEGSSTGNFGGEELILTSSDFTGNVNHKEVTLDQNLDYYRYYRIVLTVSSSAWLQVNEFDFYEAIAAEAGWANVPIGDLVDPVITDHGGLDGLSDDDHTQYHTDGRADTWLNAKQASYYPASESITYGTKTAGGYADLAAVGGTDMTIQEANGANAMQFTLGFTSVALAPNNILIYGYYAGGANHQIEVSGYNYVSAAYEHMGFITVETGKHWYSFPIFNGTSFIDGSNNASLRFRHAQSGVNTHYLYLDYVVLQHTLSVAGSGGVTDHGALQNLDHPDHPASAITLDTTNFDNNLSVADDTVQKALETLDELVAAGTADGISVSTTNFDNNLSAADDTVQKALETLDELVASGESSGYYEPVTTGDVNAPELVFADGDVIMAGPYTPPV